MARFKRGDRVRNMKETEFVYESTMGVVDEEDNERPFVIWDEVKEYAKKFGAYMRWAQDENYLELIEENKIDNNKTNIMLSDQELRIKAMEFAIAIHLTSEGMDSLAKKFEAIYNLIKTTN